VPFLYMPILHRWKRWPWAVELVPAWAKELAGASKREQIEGELWHYLYEDLSNGLFDEPSGRRTDEEGRLLLAKEVVLDFARRHELPPPSWWSDATKRVRQPSRSPVELKLAPRAIIIEASNSAYDAAEAADWKPPNIKELSAAVQSLLQQKGYRASGLYIQQIGKAEEFRHRRRLPGKTVTSERPK
jgi:hypothetical protein